MPPVNYDLPAGAEKAEFRSAHNAGFQFGQTQATVLVLEGKDGAEDGVPFAFVNGQAVNLSQFMPPRHGKMSPSFFDPDSLIEYVNKYKKTDTIIFAAFDVKSGTFTVVFDYPAPGEVSRKEHVASFTVKPTEAWTDLLDINGEAQNQDEFCEFIEKYRNLFQQPRGLEMLDIARDIQGKKEGQFAFGKRMQTGDRQIVWKEETQIRAGATGGGEETTIPEQVELAVRLFEGTDLIAVRAWLRVLVNRGTVSFKLEIQNLDDTVRASLNNIREKIKAETTLPVLLGDPGTNAAK